MSVPDGEVGPVQLLLVGFETTERFRGDIAAEVAALRGRGMIRVLDARFFHRAPDGALTEIDLNQLLGDPPKSYPGNPVAHLLGVNGGGGNGGRPPAEAFARTAGFALEDLRRLTDEIGPGEHAAVVIIEHVWASRLRESVRAASGRLLAQGFLTPEVVMIVGAELKARHDAEAAIEIAEAARGAALVEALEAVTTGADSSAEERTRSAAQVVKVLVQQGFVHEGEAGEAVDALVTSGLLESAIVQAAIAEAEDMVDE